MATSWNRKAWGRRIVGETLEHIENNIRDLSVTNKGEDRTKTISDDTDDPLGLSSLNEPLDPLVEIVFVHGLGGGSRKSWSYEHRLGCFWPGKWLTSDADFRHARIFTFGYSSTNSETVLSVAGISEFAQSLLNALNDTIKIRNSGRPIVLVGHSMGGIVIKKAFIIAKENGAQTSLSFRIQSLYFLGTPHGGSRSAEYFQKLLKVVPLRKTTDSLKDLSPTGRFLDSLSETFAKHGTNIEVRTFYENRKSKIPDAQYIVEKANARVYLANEVPEYLDTDHRGLCKFERPTDPNYAKLRNALATTVESIIGNPPPLQQDHDAQSLKEVSDYLGVQGPPEDDLLDNADRCFQGTCDWFSSSFNYRLWRDSENTNQSIASSSNLSVMLIEADPGAGKSVLSSHVISDLLGLNLYCNFFFLKSNGSKSRLSNLFLSLAFQLAQWSPIVRRDILELKQNGIVIRDLEDRLLWRKLFSSCILKSKINQPQYWIIDGLDECSYIDTFIRELKMVESIYPLRLLMTTRPSPNIRHEILQLPNHSGAGSIVTTISWENSESDIRSYVESRLSTWKDKYPEMHRRLVESIMSRANGCFLWVRLVLDSIGNALGRQEVEGILQRLPAGMNELYTSIFTRLSSKLNERHKLIIKAALQWTVCAKSGLTDDELEQAIQLELETPQVFANKICELSQNLLYIDTSKRVRLVHGTARQYLVHDEAVTQVSNTADTTFNFKFSAEEANSGIAKTLLACLKAQIQPGKSASLRGNHRDLHSALKQYAAKHFASHVRHATKDDHELLLEVDRFFVNHGIDWVAYIASLGSLDPLVKTSWNLRDWLAARADLTPPLNGLAVSTRRVHQWTVDLVRLSAKFGRQLLSSSTSIYTLVHPFIPNECVLTPNARGDQARVTGTQNECWDDHLRSFFFPAGTATAIANGGSSFAIGLKNGSVYVYDCNTFELRRILVLDNKAIVKGLQYSSSGSMLFCYGIRRCKLWDLSTGKEAWGFNTKQRYLTAAFIETSKRIICVTEMHQVLAHDVSGGFILQDFELSDPSNQESRIQRRPLVCAEVCKGTGLIATVQRGGSVRLNGLERRSAIELFLEESDDDDPAFEPAKMPVVAMTFSQNDQIPLLAIAYRDGDLAVFDYQYQRLQNKIQDLNVSMLASTSDGHTLATGSAASEIKLYNFDTLDLLHTILSPAEPPIRALTFVGRGQRLADIRGLQCCVWEPPVLDRVLTRETESTSDHKPNPTMLRSGIGNISEQRIEITAIICVPQSNHVICGFADGSLTLFNSRDGQREKPICRHSGKQWINAMTWDHELRILATLTGKFSVMVHKLSQEFNIEMECAEISSDEPVQQLLLGSKNGALELLLATGQNASLWAASENGRSSEGIHLSKRAEISMPCEGVWNYASRLSPKWRGTDLLALTESCQIRIFSMESFSNVASYPIDLQPQWLDDDITLTDSNPSSVIVRQAFAATATRNSILLELASTVSSGPPSDHGYPFPSTSQLYLVENPLASKGLVIEASELQQAGLRNQLSPISPYIEHIIGVRSDGKELYFLDKDFWVCSYELENRMHTTRSNKYFRHIIIPDDWISRPNRNNPLLFTVGYQNCIIIVRNHELVIIRHFTRLKELVDINRT